MLPEVPAVADSTGADLATLHGYLDPVRANPMDQRGGDTYWTGKGLGRAPGSPRSPTSSATPSARPPR